MMRSFMKEVSIQAIRSLEMLQYHRLRQKILLNPLELRPHFLKRMLPTLQNND